MVCVPHSVFGAQLYLTASRDTASVGDTLLVHAVLDTEGEQLNAVDGSIILSAKGTYEFSTAGSVLTIWPTTPSLSQDGKKVSFIGGVPDGFHSSQAKVFDIAVTMNETGELQLVPDHIVAYKNDGKGTPVSVATRNVHIQVTPAAKDVDPINEWNSAKTADTVPPLPFTISLGKDTTVYEGKQFITFSTTDEGSGIDYYEVKENMYAPEKNSGVYILKNQIAPETVTVSAYDKAGNVRIETVSIGAQSHTLRNSIVVSIVLLIIFVVLYRRRI